MSNTPQQVINTGELINDGTGESLRSSFTAINNNFANIWAAGPVDTQVVITNNKVSTGEINLDLILAGNGVGNVRMASTVLPTVAGVYDIGSTTEPFSEIHGQYFYGNGRFLTGISGGSGSGGNVTFSTAVPTNPNVGDIWIQSTTGVQYLYFNDNTSNVWAEMEAYQTFTSIEGNGSNIDLTSVSSNIIPATSNTYSLGNTSNQWNDLYLSNATIYMNSVPISLTASNVLTVNGQAVLSNNSNTTISTTGNITGNYFIGNGLYGTSTNDTAVLGNASGLNRVFAQNNGVGIQTYDGPNIATHTWSFNFLGDLYLPTGDVGIYYANGDPYGGSASTGNLDIVGTNITIAAGATETQINISPNGESWAFLQIPNDATANVANVRLHNDVGNIELSTGSGSHNWYFDNTGTLTLPNNANITTIDGVVTQLNSVSTANGAINLRTFDAGGNVTASSYYDGGDASLNFYTFNTTTDTGYNWRFDNGGSFTLPNAPGNIYLGDGAYQPVIIPEFDGITLSANRADAAVDYLTVSQNGINLFSVNTINIENNTTGLNNSDININAGDDIFLRGRDRPTDTEQEGGDIRIESGNGADTTSNANDPGGGGDMMIWAGNGGSGTGSGANGSSGGYLELIAGDGGSTVDANAGSGGDITLRAGAAGTPADPAFGGWGGSISLIAGDTTRVDENGGSITLTTGDSTGLGTGASGYVEISIPASNVGPGGNWYFTGTGRTLEVPGDSEIFGPNLGNFTVGCAGNTIVTSSDYGANVKNWVFGYTGTLSLPGISTGTGTGEAQAIAGSRKTIGSLGTDYAYASTSEGHTAFGSVAWTASSNLVQSAKVTFAVQTNGTAYNWEQFDVAICGLDSANAIVSVSNRVRKNSAIAFTEVSGYVSDGVLEIWLNPADGQTSAYINYDAVEFNIMVD